MHNVESASLVPICLESQIDPDPIEPVVSSNSGLRKFLGGVAVVAGSIAGAWGGIGIVSPSAERTIGPSPVEATVSWGNSVDVVGISVADTKLIGADIDPKIDLSQQNLDQSIRRLSPIVEEFEESGDQAAFRMFLDEYDKEINDLAIELGIKTTAVIALGALIGAWSTLKLIEKSKLYPDKTKNSTYQLRHVALGTVMAILGSGSGVAYNISQLSSNEVEERLTSELEKPFKEYLQTGTSKMAFNLEQISEETQVQIGRWLRITRSLTETKTVDTSDQQTWAVYSDPHNLPTVPSVLESISRAGEVDALIGLGDYNNTGSDFEMDSLGGMSIGKVSFPGFNSIRSCEKWEPNGQDCQVEGQAYKHGVLSGNHDPKRLLGEFSLFGFTDLNQAKSFSGIPIVGLADACFVNSDCHNGEYKKRNREVAEEYALKLDKRAIPPKIGFFASEEAAKAFYGKLDTIMVGGSHEFKSEVKDDTLIIHVGSIGQGFPRTSESASMILITVKKDGGLASCTNISWQTMKIEAPSLAPCI